MLAKLSISLAMILAAGCGDTFVATSGGGGSGGQTATGATGGSTGGTGGSGGAGGGVTCSSIDIGLASCNSCLEKSCATPYCACSNNPDCAALVACVNKTGPNPQSEEYQKCLEQRPNSISLVGRISACGTDKCPACGFMETKCSACLYDHCDKQVNACYSNPDCTGYINCVKNCGIDAGCKADCATGEHKAGVGPAGALQTCATTTCGSSCPPAK
jgi:hypothetical protein